MSAVASKNLYDLLGNDPDQDPELRTPEPPVQPIDKTAARAGKRNGTAEAPVKDQFQTDGAGRGRGGDRRGRGRGRARGSDGSFLDSDVGRQANRDKPTEDGFRENDRGSRFSGEGRGRGRGRGRAGGRGGRDDRHSHHVQGATPDDGAKQAAAGWGADTGNAEWADENAGQAIAEEEKKDEPVWDSGAAAADGMDDQFGGGAATGDQFGGGAATGDQFGDAPAAENGAPAAEPEPEDNSKSYADYLAEQAEKKLQLGGTLQARQANEGAKSQPEGKKVERQEAEFFAGSGPKAAKQRERKVKETILIDSPFYAAREQDSGFRGGRGRGRGEGRGRGRGEGGFRGDRENRGDRGERPEGRGSGRGYTRGRGGDSEFRGRGGGRGAGTNAAQPDVSSSQDFPGLGVA